MINNKYKVLKKLWSEFETDTAKRVYNDVMDMAIKNQAVTIHPKQDEIPKEQWKTICHNMAFYAVQSVLKQKLQSGNIVIDMNSKGEEVKRRKFN